MGVAGAVGLLKREGYGWSSTRVLRDTKVVIDITNGLYWAVKKHLIEGPASGGGGGGGGGGWQMDRYGTSMLELGHYYRQLFRQLQARNCKPYVVYDGARMSESEHGELASKTRYMTRSSANALDRLKAGRYRDLCSLPDLATNCLKEIVNECGLASEQLHQAVHEVYPELERLAREHECPVLTSHSDFIFSDVPQGFIWLEEMRVPEEPSAEWRCTVYSHRSMLAGLQLQPGRAGHSPALNCLRVLMRDDFCEAHTELVNRVLELRRPGGMPIPHGNTWDRKKTARLRHIVHNWPRALTSVDSVRASLGDGNGRAVRDFESILASYTVCHHLESSDLVRPFAAGQDRLRDLQDSLLRRESTADFLANLRLIDFRRTNIQDVRTFRSTYSLCDRVKQYLAERICQPEGRLFDRERAYMRHRLLDAANQGALMQASLSRDVLFTLFHFDERVRESLARALGDAHQLDADHAKRLALLLLLARFSLKLTPRENYDNTDQLEGRRRRRSRASKGSRRNSSNPADQARSNSSDSSRSSSNSGSKSNSNSKSKSKSASRRPQPQPGTLAHRYHRRELAVKYYTAILNSFIYHLGPSREGDQASREVPADRRVARLKIYEIAKAPPNVQANPASDEYIITKHLVEALNSTLHGYKELNSLYNFPGPNMLVNKHYDAVLVYKLMTRYSNTLAGHLLKLTEDIERELCAF